MYPVLFRIGSFEITSFGGLVAAGALVGLLVFRRELRLSGLPSQAVDAAVLGVFGGLIGAKLLWTFEHWGEGPLTSLVLSRGGMSWFGGVLGGLAAGVWMIKRRRWPMMPILSAATPAAAVGHAIGRVGCFFVGDDYGRPSNLPWAVAFPEGLPPRTVRVHPTQLYEALFLVLLGWLLTRWRRRVADSRIIVGRYLTLALGFRFVLEFIRINERVAFGLTVAQWISVGGVIVGMVLLMRPRGTPPTSTESSRKGI